MKTVIQEELFPLKWLLKTNGQFIDINNSDTHTSWHHHKTIKSDTHIDIWTPTFDILTPKLDIWTNTLRHTDIILNFPGRVFKGQG